MRTIVRTFAAVSVAVTAAAIGACSDDAATAPRPTRAFAGDTSAARLPAPNSASYSLATTGVMTLYGSEGGVTLNVNTRTLTTDDGVVVTLAPDALALIRTEFEAIAAGDAAVAAAQASGYQPPPPPRCDPNVQSCSGEVFEPNRVKQPDFSKPSQRGEGRLSSSGLDIGTAQVPWNCRDISRSIYDLTPSFHAARSVEAKMYQRMTKAARPLAGGGPVTRSVWLRARAATFGWELAKANLEYFRTRLGFLGTLFNANACLYRAWDTAPLTNYPAGTGGGEGGGPPGSGGSTMKCYYIVTYDGAVEIARELIECRVTMAN